jgi:nucleotide-binding universal stress UspA family protein
VPVLVLRGQPESPLQRVLLTTDTSLMSGEVYDVGLEVADVIAGHSRFETRSLLVVAYDTVLPPPLRRDLLAEAAENEHRRFLSERDLRERPVEGKIRYGDPAGEIVAEAESWNADLVVLGTHARSGLEKLLLGSVAGSVLRAAPCNVLIVPPTKWATAGAGDEIARGRAMLQSVPVTSG